MMMTTALRDLAATWGSFYANHAAMRTAIAFAHVGGLVAAGGASMMADREILSRRRRREQGGSVALRTVQKTHGIVVAGLAIVIASGVLLFAADVATYAPSKLFWIKMAMVAALMINGAILVRVDRGVAEPDERTRRLMRWTAGLSLALWFLTTLAGAGLPNI
jgi:hypothetical protein